MKLNVSLIRAILWWCALVLPKHELSLNFSNLIAVCSSSPFKWARRLLKTLAFNWRTRMCRDSGDSSRELPLVNFNYSQHACALIQLNCCGKAEAQLLLAQSNGSSGITHLITEPLHSNQNINLETTCLYTSRGLNPLTSPSTRTCNWTCQ